MLTYSHTRTHTHAHTHTYVIVLSNTKEKYIYSNVKTHPLSNYDLDKLTVS